MITFAPGLGLQELQRSSRQLLVSPLPGWSVIDSEHPWQGGVSWSGHGCFAVLELGQQGLETGIVQWRRCWCNHGQAQPWVVLGDGWSNHHGSTSMLYHWRWVRALLPKAVSLCRCLLAPHTVSYRQKPRVFKLSAELSEVSTHSNVLLPVAEDLLLTVLVLFGSHIRFYCLEVQSCMDT